MAPQIEQLSEERLATESMNHLNSAALRAYSGQKQACRDGLEDEQIAEFLPMVSKIARQVVTYLKPPLSFEDMVSAGTVGLVRAARDYDPSHQTEFKTYAYIRIRGAILDELRCWAFVPANLNKRIREAQQLSRKITEQTGAPPTDPELAERLGVTVEELYETYENARAQHFISLDGSSDEAPALGTLLATPRAASPDERIQREELVEKLAESILQLFEKQRQVVLLYYQQQLTMKEIAEIMGLTESRVSQLHASALFSLSIKLKQWKDGGL